MSSLAIELHAVGRGRTVAISTATSCFIIAQRLPLPKVTCARLIKGHAKASKGLAAAVNQRSSPHPAGSLIVVPLGDTQGKLFVTRMRSGYRVITVVRTQAPSPFSQIAHGSPSFLGSRTTEGNCAFYSIREPARTPDALRKLSCPPCASAPNCAYLYRIPIQCTVDWNGHSTWWSEAMTLAARKHAADDSGITDELFPTLKLTLVAAQCGASNSFARSET
jgi:hypothetical protein